MELRDYQKIAVDSLRSSLARGNKRIILQASCGAGKTIISAEITRLANEKGKKVLFLVNRRDLVNQTLAKYEAYGLQNQIGIIMAGQDPSHSNPIQLATLQTYSRRLKLCSLDANRWFCDADLILYDECHSANAPTYKEILQIYDGKPIIGLSATPMGAAGSGLGGIFQEIVQCIPMSELIEKGFLVPAVHYAPSKPDLENLKITAGDYNRKDLEKRVNKPKLVGDIFDNWIRLASGRSTIIFASGVKHSRAIRDEFRSKGITADHIDAHTKDDDRDDIYRRFESGDLQVLTNVGVCCEGSDLPIASCIVLARPTMLLSRYIQMAGRGARPYPGKKDFLLLDHAGCIDKHGFADEDVEWSLDSKKPAAKKKVKRTKEKKIFTCEMCSRSFAGKRCPECGNEIKDWSKKIEAIEADLVAVKGECKKTYTTKEHQDWWSQFEYERRRLGKSVSWLKAQYKSKFGKWYNDSTMQGIAPKEPTQEVKNFLTYQRIKWIKSKKNNPQLTLP